MWVTMLLMPTILIYPSSLILSAQSERIGELLHYIRERAGAGWWAWQGWDLSVDFNKSGNRLGIESLFRHGTLDNPLDDFEISFTVWNRRHYEPYREALNGAFRDCYLDEHPKNDPSRIYLQAAVVEGADINMILDKLAEVYSKVKAITEQKNNQVRY